MIGLVEIEWGSEECRRHHPAVSFIFQRQRSNAIMSPHWRGCYSLERWKSINDCIQLQFALFGLIFSRTGGMRRRGHSHTWGDLRLWRRTLLLFDNNDALGKLLIIVYNIRRDSVCCIICSLPTLIIN